MEKDYFVSERAIKEVKLLIDKELGKDKEASKIAKKILERYIKGGAKAVKEYIRDLLAEVISNAYPKEDRDKGV